MPGWTGGICILCCIQTSVGSNNTKSFEIDNKKPLSGFSVIKYIITVPLLLTFNFNCIRIPYSANRPLSVLPRIPSNSHLQNTTKNLPKIIGVVSSITDIIKELSSLTINGSLRIVLHWQTWIPKRNSMTRVESATKQLPPFLEILRWEFLTST